MSRFKGVLHVGLISASLYSTASHGTLLKPLCPLRQSSHQTAATTFEKLTAFEQKHRRANRARNPLPNHREDLMRILEEGGKPLDFEVLASQGVIIEPLLDAKGAGNRGIFRLTYPNGLTTIVKRIHELHSYGLAGNLLADSVPSAPRIISFGIDKGEKGEAKIFYIEMEELFPNQKRWELKTLTSFWKDRIFPVDQAVQIISKSDKNGKPIYRALAEMETELLERKIIYWDRDFMISEDGQIRWVDVDGWHIEEKSDDPYFIPDTAVGTLVKTLSHLEFKEEQLKDLPDQLKVEYFRFHNSHLNELSALIRASSKITVEEKAQAETGIEEYRKSLLETAKRVMGSHPQ